jgi:hypothetical protein
MPCLEARYKENPAGDLREFASAPRNCQYRLIVKNQNFF